MIDKAFLTSNNHNRGRVVMQARIPRNMRWSPYYPWKYCRGYEGNETGRTRELNTEICSPDKTEVVGSSPSRPT